MKTVSSSKGSIVPHVKSVWGSRLVPLAVRNCSKSKYKGLTAALFVDKNVCILLPKFPFYA